MHLFLLLVSIFLCTLSISPLKHLLIFFTYFIYFFVSFLPALHQPQSHFIPRAISLFSNEADEQIRRQCVMKNMLDAWQILPIQNVLRNCKYPANKWLLLFFFFSVIHLGRFSIDQMKSLCWTQGIRTMSLETCCNISDAETALKRPYYSQLAS